MTTAEQVQDHVLFRVELCFIKENAQVQYYIALSCGYTGCPLVIDGGQVLVVEYDPIGEIKNQTDVWQEALAAAINHYNDHLGQLRAKLHDYEPGSMSVNDPEE